MIRNEDKFGHLAEDDRGYVGLKLEHCSSPSVSRSQYSSPPQSHGFLSTSLS